jgi:alpha-amylase/alpha-mannosidase (GH57 family)
MHQPYYKDDLDGLYHMPWVYLHALKDYYELPYYHEKFEGIKGTYNLVPSLLIQMKDYESVDVSDTFLQLIQKPSDTLTQEEKDILIPQLFMSNYKNMVRPLKRYKELYDRKGDLSLFETSGIKYSDAEITDLEVMFLLSWCGVFTREKLNIISRLIKKERHFSQEEKIELIEELSEFISDIVPLYESLQQDEKIEVSTTPFYHPILPLLLDPKSAKEALPSIKMPGITTDFSDEAEFHVSSAIDYYENIFSQRPEGMWPAEGSISEAAANLFAEKGIKWIASDEDVLAGSTKIKLRDRKNRNHLYKKHVYQTPSGDINIFFRDKELSDLIGFTYSGWEAEKAVDDFMEKLSDIHDMCGFSPIVPVILDGENAWEYYPNNAYDFFSLLYKRLQTCNWVETMTMSEAMESDTPTSYLEDIRAGSWIYANFTTWMGHEEKNEGWKMLSEVHRRYQQKKHDLENTAQIEKELHIAEGSDWFWWYGDDHFSLQSDVFDKLFRNHIANIYELMGEKVPHDVTRPIKKSHRSGLLKKPASYISPDIDGRVTSFFEWMGAGRFDLKFDAGAMTASGNAVSMLHFGFDDKNIYLRLDGNFRSITSAGYSIDIEITTDETIVLNMPISDCLSKEKGIEFCTKEIFECTIPKAIINSELKKAFLAFKLKKDKTVVETLPLYNTVEIDFSEDFNKDWIA